jgi:amino ABC transporter, permease protein, 3-TM region, his/glu/gln/arg/opine family
MKFFDVIFGNGRWIYFWHGLEVTIVLTILALFFGFLLGVLISMLRTSSVKFCQKIANLYVTIIRGTPLLVQLLIMYYVIFAEYRAMPKIIVAAVAFSLNSGAYISEIIRGGIESVSNGQKEAARSLGLSEFSTQLYVVMPQALKNSLPSLIGEGISLFKETSIVGWIGLGDIMRGADDIRSLTATAFESLVAAAIIYLAITLIFTKIMSKVEKRLA